MEPSHQCPDATDEPAVVVVGSHPEDFSGLARALHAAGISMLLFTSIAELERWPANRIVVTDSKHVTPIWKEVGARCVIAVGDDPAEAPAALRRGATGWVSRLQAPGAVVALSLGADAA